MGDKYRRGEFEARNRQLPADLDQTIAYNANARARADFDVTPVGTPPVCYDVRSVFDSRPINAFDFHITGFGAIASTDHSVVVEMTVPEGYCAILRGIEIWFEPTPLGVNRSDVFFSLQLNGGNYPYNSLPIGPGTTDLLPMFMLADEFNRIGALITFSNFSADAGCYVHFYGNFLLKTERALPFEVANPSADPACKPPTAARRAVQRPPVVPSVPILTAPPPVAPRPLPTPTAPVPPSAVRSTPDFAVNWRASGGGNNAMLIPMQNDRGQRRDLSVTEVRQYLAFLNAQKLNSKEREMFSNFLRATGVT